MAFPAGVQFVAAAPHLLEFRQRMPCLLLYLLVAAVAAMLGIVSICVVGYVVVQLLQFRVILCLACT